MDENIRRLEEKIAYLERHVTEQDKAMLELAEEIAALRRDVKAWRDRGNAARHIGESDDGGGLEHERPPHY